MAVSNFKLGLFGCLVMERTLSHVRPNGSMIRGEVATIRGIGMYTNRLLTKPVVNAVYPAIAPCTAFCASNIQYKASEALAGTDLKHILNINQKHTQETTEMEYFCINQTHINVHMTYLIMYEGSRYFTVAICPCFAKYSVTFFFINSCQDNIRRMHSQ